jgi:hypothetical protein
MGTWTRTERCQAKGLCLVDSEGNTGQCTMPQCMEGQLKCEPNQDLMRCGSDLQWHLSVSCAPAMCDPILGCK